MMNSDPFSKFDREDLEVDLKEPSVKEPFPAPQPSPAKCPKLDSEFVFEANIQLTEPFSESEVPVSSSSVQYESSSPSEQSHKSESVSDYSDGIIIDEPFVVDSFDSYDGCDNTEDLYSSSTLTVLKSLAILFSWFCSSPGTSKESFGRLLHVLSVFILPPGNLLPSSYNAALSIIQHALVPVQKYDACINDCVVYRKCQKEDLTDLSECPKCNEPRYEIQSKIGRKVFKYVPLAPRLAKMFKSNKVSEDLQSHLSSCDSTVISDIHQSKAWKARYRVGGPFNGDARGVCLSMCTDGMNPFSKEKIAYSMWPISLTILNLPRHVRNLPGSMLLAGIIPGREEPKHLDPYLDILVDEIMEIDGLQFFDGYRQENFTLKIDILLHILDYPGHNKVFHCQGAGAFAGCAYCTHRGEYSKILQKVVYPGNRQFLPDDDPLRNDCNNFPAKQVERSCPPDLKTTQYVANANEAYVNAQSSKEKLSLAQKTGCKGPYSLGKLPLHERFLGTPIDPMHLIKNIVEHCIRFITGIEDSLKVRQEERARNRFRLAWLIDDRACTLPPAPFILQKDEISLANERANSILVHSSTDWHPRAIFGKRAGMKAHEWMEVVTKGVLKFCLRGMLGQNQRHTLFKLFDVIACMCAEEVAVDSIDNLEQEVHRTLALFERDFPVALQVIVFHLLHHLPTYIRQFGPVYGFWMYPYERFNSWISRRVLNRRYPESTVIETYRLSEWAGFMELSSQLATGSTHLCLDASSRQENEDLLKDRNENFVKDVYHLTDEQLGYLRSCYMGLFPEFQQNVEEVEGELSQDSSGEITACRIDELLQPFVTQMKLFTYKDSHGRKIKLSTIESDREFSSSRCSYIAAIVDNVLTVGHVLTLFEHNLCSRTTTFAYVSWFGNLVRDNDTNLNYVFTTVQTQSIVSVNQLSKPLVVAFDEEEVGKLWILSKLQ